MTEKSKKFCIYGLVRGYSQIQGYDDLRRRNKLLHENFNKNYNYDLIIFHEGNINLDHQNIIKTDIPNIIFIDISDKCFQKNTKIISNWRKSMRKYIGYSHMCRFYGIQMYEYLKDYEYIMRFDEDIFLRSSINFDLYTFMKENDYLIGYGRRKIDGHKPTKRTFFPFIKKYINDNKIEVLCDLKEIDNRNFYNNFCILKTDFWFQENVLKYLNHIDNDYGIYRHRWGDSPIQATALRMFTSENRWYKFTEFEYGHGSHGWNNKKSKIKDEW